MTIDILKMDPKTEMPQDFLPSTMKYGAVPTGVYPYIIELAYLGESRNGAVELNLECKPADEHGSFLRTTLYVTTNKAGGRSPTKVQEDGSVRPVMGRERMEELARICCTKGADQLATEVKIIKKRNFDTGQDEPVEVPAVTELMGKPVLLGLQQVETNAWKNRKMTNESKFKNEISKVFDPKGFTYSEIAQGVEEPEFIHKWKEANGPDYIRDNKRVVKSAAPAVPAPSMGEGDDGVPWGGDDSEESTSLFNNPT